MATCECGATIGRKSKRCTPCHMKVMQEARKVATAKRAADKMAQVGAVGKVPEHLTRPVEQTDVARVGPSYTETQPGIFVQDGLDPTVMMHQQPGYSYRIARLNRSSQHSAKGWQFVKQGDPEMAPFIDHGRADNLKGFGGADGMAVMRIPTERLEGRQKAMRERLSGAGRREHEATLQKQVAQGIIGEKQAEKLRKDGYSLRERTMGEVMAEESGQ